MTLSKINSESFLQDEDIQEICEQAFQKVKPDGRKLLFVIPDNTRSAPIDRMFRAIYSIAANRAAALDFIVALGTHPPMSDEEIDRRLGLKAGDRETLYPKARFFNHQWKKEGQLRKIGTLTTEDVQEISEGRMSEPVDITINKMVFDYDAVIIVGPVFPHEVVGFSGGNKYLFPGISGQEIIDMFHWLGALITSPGIIGRAYTPVRAVVDKAASFLKMEKYAFTLVVKGHGDLAGLFFDEPEPAWEEAAKLSDRLHIVYKDHPFRQILSVAPTMYDDLWVGAKCMYKLEPVVADDGELIIYAPHIHEISVTHGPLIEEIGYHSLPYFTTQMHRFSHIPGGILAHSTHVRGAGSYEDGVERNRVRVTLATGIPEELCRKINLGYRDPESINFDDFKDREDEGILFVPRAGEMLYRLK